MARIDFHTHSLCSDGSFSPAGLAAHAKELGLKGFALTDHDTISGLAEAQEEAARLGVGFLPGMEMSLFYRGRRLHVVALGFDSGHPAFQSLYRHIRSIKESGIERILAGVEARGLEIHKEDVVPFALGDLVDLYAVMRYIVSLGCYESASEIWDRYLDPAVAETGLEHDVTPEEALPAIRAAGGVTSLAHFHKTIGLKGLTDDETEEAIQELKGFGLDGMEQFYPNYTVRDMAFAGYLIHKYDLLATGGSDFHGKNRPGVEMGFGMDGNLFVPEKIWEGVEEQLHERR